MLIEFRVANYRSFKEEQTLSMVAGNRDSRHPENLVPHKNFRLLKTAAIYGANASGKSNLIRAMGAMIRFIRDSVTRMGPEDRIPCASPFRLSTETIEGPSSFEIMIVEDGVRHVYGFSVTAERVTEEWLTTYPLPPKRRHDQLSRLYEPEKGEYDWRFQPSLKKSDEDLLREKTRPNQLALSRAADLSIEPFASLSSSFDANLLIVDPPDDTTVAVQQTAQFMLTNPDLQPHIGDMIRHADIGIVNLSITATPFSLEEVNDQIKSVLSSFITAMKVSNSIQKISVHSTHLVSGEEADIEFDFFTDESDGTKRFFVIARHVLSCLRSGSVLVVDEIDRSLHPLLTRKIIEMFHSPTANPKGAQLVFVTHDCTLMEPDLFRRDQIWLIDKDRQGASEMFSLYDFDTKKRPRDTTAFRQNYLDGRYRGIPNLGSMEDMEIG